jgi:hypothetical protein
VTLQDLGNLGELISAIAVVISLAYLAVQIRQNTKSVRTSTYQAILDSSRSDTQLILAHPHLERIYHVGRRDINALTDEERPVFRMLVGQLLLTHEIMFLQHERGVIDENLWESRQTALRALLMRPGVRQWWTESTNRRSYYDRGFQELVDSFLRSGSPRDEPAV